MKMDILEELPLEKWPLLQEKLKQDWPQNVPAYYTLYFYQKYPTVRDAFKFKVYCANGNIDNGFVGIRLKNSTHYIIVYSSTGDTKKLESALIKTKLIIDWNKECMFEMVPCKCLPMLNRLNEAKGFQSYRVEPYSKYYLDHNEAQSFSNLRCPDNTCVTGLKQEDIQRVDNAWAYQDSGSYTYFSILASIGSSYGLYSLNKELLAWVFVNEYNHICHLHCFAKHRRQGYGEYIMKYAVNELLKENCDVCGFVVEGNDRASALFTKLGFEMIDSNSAWVIARM